MDLLEILFKLSEDYFSRIMVRIRFLISFCAGGKLLIRVYYISLDKLGLETRYIVILGATPIIANRF